MKMLKRILLLLFIVPVFANANNFNINILSEDAKRTNKITMIFFHITPCPYCKKMLKEMYEGKDSMAIINKNFYYVDITADEDGMIIYNDFKGTPMEFKNYFGIKLYPTVLFLKDNEVIYYTAGYKSKKTFFNTLKYVVYLAEPKMSYDEFIEDLMFAD